MNSLNIGYVFRGNVLESGQILGSSLKPKEVRKALRDWVQSPFFPTKK